MSRCPRTILKILKCAPRGRPRGRAAERTAYTRRSRGWHERRHGTHTFRLQRAMVSVRCCLAASVRPPKLWCVHCENGCVRRVREGIPRIGIAAGSERKNVTLRAGCGETTKSATTRHQVLHSTPEFCYRFVLNIASAPGPRHVVVERVRSEGAAARAAEFRVALYIGRLPLATVIQPPHTSRITFRRTRGGGVHSNT